MCWLGPGRQQLDPARKSPRALRCTEILLNLREFDVNGTATALICRVRPERGLATSHWPRLVHALRVADWDKFHTDRQSRLGSHSSGRALAAISPETSFLFLFLFLFLIPYSLFLFLIRVLFPNSARGENMGNKGRIRFPNPNPGTRRRRRLNKGAPQARFFWAYSALCGFGDSVFGKSRPNLILSAEQMNNLEKGD